MCGIVASIGTKHARKQVLDGLAILEYRGYDSAGIGIIEQKTGLLKVYKRAGHLSHLHNLLSDKKLLEQESFVAIGHTRWATHGNASTDNAHPHQNCAGTIAVVHNGIIENEAELRKKHAITHYFASQTDSELLAHVFSDILKEARLPGTYGSSAVTPDADPGQDPEHIDRLKKALITLTQQITGAYGLVIMLQEYPDLLCVIRHRSPLVLGLGAECSLVASDQSALPGDIKNLVYLPDQTVGIITKTGYQLFDFNGTVRSVPVSRRSDELTRVGRDGFDHYMLKEIYEQKRAITKSIALCQLLADTHQLWAQMGLTPEEVKNCTGIEIIAAGSSWHAGLISQFYFEQIAQVPVAVHLASEFRYRSFFPDTNKLYLFITQSGETADTLEALRFVLNNSSCKTIALTNVATSTIVREAGGVLLMQAGPEISVASTKAFSSQVATLYWLAYHVGLARGVCTAEQAAHAQTELLVAAQALEEGIEQYKGEISHTLAPRYKQYKSFIFLGRHIGYPFAREAALKLKEISYIFAQAYPAGELKHGPIALVDNQTPVVIFSTYDSIVYAKLCANAQEVKARGAHLIIYAFASQHELHELADTLFIVPDVTPLLAPLAMTGIMQVFAYEVTHQLGLPVDKPRNLAKSVTVE